MRCGRCAAETPRFQSYEEVSQVAIQAGYVMQELPMATRMATTPGSALWFCVQLAPKALSVFEVVKFLDNHALCSGLLIDE
jgi:hypothetical protein